MKNFLICFKIAKRNGGVLYPSDIYNRGFVYSVCRNLCGTPLCDFRIGKTGQALKWGKELETEDRKLFYNVKQ
jgi:hypothetical protein